jgi:hypothetical protein
MKKLLILLVIITPAWGICLFDCNTPSCARLEYYLKKCNKCSKISSKCAKAFCANHPRLCSQSNRPIRPLSVGTLEIVEEEIRDVCLAKLFAPRTFYDSTNNDINMTNLNMIGVQFFAQTGGEAKERNLLAVQNILVNYLLYIQPSLNKLPDASLKKALDQWIDATFHMPLAKANNFQYYMMIEYVRRDLYKRKGIPTQVGLEFFNRQKYPMTISKLGCPSEKVLEKPK